MNSRITKPLTVALVIALVTASLAIASPAWAVAPGCGDANNDGSVSATDSLATLLAAVGSTSCDKVRCDVNNDNKVSATDALTVLKSAVGQAMTLNCPGVAITTVDSLPLATAPVAPDGQDVSGALLANAKARAKATVGAAGGGAIPIGANGDFYNGIDQDAHKDVSIAACEMVNRVRNAITWAAEADQMLCYIREILGSQADGGIDFYDGLPHVLELSVAHPGFCVGAQTPTSCRSDADCGSEGPCMSFDQEGEDDIHIKVRMERASDAVDSTVKNFELFACEDIPSESFSLTIELDDTVTFSALQVDVDYAAVGGSFEGFGSDVECTSDLTSTGALFVANDNEAEKTLSLGIVSLAGITGPTTLATCTFTQSGGGMLASDFIVAVTDAADVDSNPIRPTASIAGIDGSDQGRVQTQYVHQAIDGNSFSMISKGIHSDDFGVGSDAVTVSATLNDLGQFTDSKTITIRSSFSDANFGFSGISEETFIQEADRILMSGAEKGSNPGQDWDGDGKIDGGDESHTNRVIGVASLVDGNTSADKYDVSLIGIGVGAAKAAMTGSSSFVPCTLQTCGFDESCDRLGLEEDDEGHCLNQWGFTIVEGWNAGAEVSPLDAASYIEEVVDATLPELSGVTVSFADTESYDCAEVPEVTLEIDMFSIIQECGDLMVETGNNFSCYATAGGEDKQDCGGPDLCSISQEPCSPLGECPLPDDICEPAPPCDFDDPCLSDNPPDFCGGMPPMGGGQQGNCCQATFGTPGCMDPALEATVCAQDNYCCDIEWDPPCVQIADANGAQCFDFGEGIGPDNMDPCLSDFPPPFCKDLANGIGPCCFPHPNPGCDDELLTQQVCELDSFCCEGQWDDACVKHANDAGANCFGAGPGMQDPCASPNPPPYCFDGFGDPCAGDNPPPFCFGPVQGSGDCCMPTPGQPGCADPDITACVCDKDEFCCTGEWDQACVQLANSCGGACVDPNLNDPCFSPNPPDWCKQDFDPCQSPFPPPFCNNGLSPAEQGNCCQPTFGTPGCTDTQVESCVCGQDSYCCDGEWDGPCVALAGACNATCFDGVFKDPCSGPNPEPWCDVVGDPCASPNPPAWCSGPSTGPGFDPGTSPGFDPGTDPGFDPGVDPGFDPCADPNPPTWCFDPGVDPTASPGASPRTDPNASPGFDPCADPNPPTWCFDPGVDPAASPGASPRTPLG